MPSVGHLAVGLTGARLAAPSGHRSRWPWAILLMCVSLAPDLDVIAFSLGIPYAAPFGHRGAVHSVVFAGLGASALALAAPRFGIPRARAAAIGGLVMASHGVLDTFTDGGLGVALLWPFTDGRYFAPWRPIPVAPIGLRLFSPEGLALMLNECLLFLPAFIAGFWPRRPAAREP